MPFEKYQKWGRSLGSGIRITATGYLYCTKDLIALFEGAKRVELYFDPQKSLIGIKPVSDPAKSASVYSVSAVGRRGQQITGKKFCEYYNIDTKNKVFYPLKTQENGMFIFGPIKRSNLKKIDEKAKIKLDTGGETP